MSTESRSRLWMVVVALLIVGASSRSTVAAPDVPNIDKLAHFGIYGLLATHLHLSGLTKGRLWLTVLACSLFGFTDEIHQYFTPGRSCSVWDWIADTLGAATACLLLTRWTPYRTLLLRRLA